ncbi:unnamed protein product [Protopolystoma xenopodis]|uniref:CpG binding protein C-terminal domain-containing protein n=1 Tax=Protopolystoma xenopodis TaxID=117903 RepID=A0A3S5A1A4_9PLAT|nr:unnamed protein product [Protopolystoma xenopodis]
MIEITKYSWNRSYSKSIHKVFFTFRRIAVLLPAGIESHSPPIAGGHNSSPCPIDTPQVPQSVANRIDRCRLASVREEQVKVNRRLIALEAEHQRLTAEVARGRERSADPAEKEMVLNCDMFLTAVFYSFKAVAMAQNLEEAEQMEQVVCVTCATEVNMRHALRHMEKCFQKLIF